MLVGIALSLTIIFAAIGDVLFSRGMLADGEVKIGKLRDVRTLTLRILTSKLVLMGALCMGGHIAAYSLSLALVDVSVANPLTALSYVITTTYVGFVVHERIGFRRWMGVLLITIGAVLVGMSSK